MNDNASQSENVVYGRFGSPSFGSSAKAIPGVNEIEKLRLGDVDSASRKSVLGHLSATFKSLVRRPVDIAWIDQSDGQGVYDHTRPNKGPYNSFIGYFEDGSPNHALRYLIDKLRDQRAFTRNAVELRCDALCLAIYVSGITQIDPADRKAREGVRVVVYDHDNIKHTELFTAKTAEELVDKLHHVLITTYNRLAREYNLAGFTVSFLTLKSSHKAIPDIRIDMQN